MHSELIATKIPKLTGRKSHQWWIFMGGRKSVKWFRKLLNDVQLSLKYYYKN